MQSKGTLRLTGKELRCAAMPLGGIGTGSIAIGGDGLLKQWQITNRVYHDAFIPNSFFSVWTKSEEKQSRALICSRVNEDSEFKPAKSVSDHIIPLAAEEMFKILPGVEEIVFDGEYPLAFLQYKDKKLPVDISLKTFSPFIPLDPKNSGLPIIIFCFDIKNTSNEPCEVNIAGSFLNFLGWDGFGKIQGNENPLFGGNINTHKTIGNWHIINMKSKILMKNDRRYGDLSFGIDQNDVIITTQWNDLKTFWSQFSKNGSFPSNFSDEMSPIGESWVGSLGSKKVLAPNEKFQIKFFFAWNFPNRVVDWYMNQKEIQDESTEYWIGNRYNEWFDSSLEVITYVKKNLNYLMRNTEKYHEDLFCTTLQSEVVNSISATSSIIRTPTCFWIRDGNFHAFEGCCGASTKKYENGGSCPLNCTHVWNYEFTMAYLFPSLERTMRETEFKVQNKDGYLPHREVLPNYLPQYKIEIYPNETPAIDGMFGMILKIYRDYLFTGDLEFLNKSWSSIKKLMEYIWENNDKNSNGVIYNAQGNTYDRDLYGLNSFITSLYLATLLACKEIAKRLNKKAWMNKCEQLYKSGRKILDNECWNGEYYIQKIDKPITRDFQYGDGCLSDQLVGQWWAFELGFGYILPKDHVKKAIDSILKYNYKENFKGIQQLRVFASEDDSGLLNCTWPYGGKPKVPIRYNNEVWTGIEYEVAALCIYTGKISEGLKIVQSVRDRYDGSTRNPWNEVECGDHYVRAMASWTILNALTGLEYNVEDKRLEFYPRINREIFKSFFISDNGWGRIAKEYSNNSYRFSIISSYGEFEIKSLSLMDFKDFKIDTCSILVKPDTHIGSKPLEVDFKTNNSTIEISLKDSITLKKNHQLIINLS